MHNICKTCGSSHPLKLTCARWRWPFKTPTEQAIIARWFKKQPVQGEEALL